MEEIEYSDNEKVIFKTRVKLSLPRKEPEEVDCFVTEDHLIIKGKEPMKIRKTLIQNCGICVIYRAVAYLRSREPYLGEATLTFLNNNGKKHNLLLEMDAADLGYFELAIKERRSKSEVLKD